MFFLFWYQRTKRSRQLISVGLLHAYLIADPDFKSGSAQWFHFSESLDPVFLKGKGDSEWTVIKLNF